MYIYNQQDQTLVNQRVEQFRQQTARFIAGEIAPAEFLPLRLQNGLYMQRHAHMLRISVPYGMLSSKQLRMLGFLAKNYDKNYGHFTTRQNLQFNWPHLEDVPDMLAHLASVEMHAIQTSGNCIRNITSDEFAGVDADELIDPRPYCELVRQWSTFHPEFAYLPRKFKIAISGRADSDHAATWVHDIGLQLRKDAQGNIGCKVLVGGGLGRTPVIGSVIHEHMPIADLLSYLEAIVRVYNRYGRRDNKYKARIKILVKALGIDTFKAQVEAQWQTINRELMRVPEQEIVRLKSHFTDPAYQILSEPCSALTQALSSSAAFKSWYEINTLPHKQSGYRIAVVSLKATGVAPGDVSGEQLNALADLADRYSFGEVRVTHHQNIVLADVKQSELFALWQDLVKCELATANHGLVTDIICCPGGDFCSLANAKSIPIAEAIQQHVEQHFDAVKLGNLTLNISGCMNACGHHHVGNIGILGVDKKGKEYYQIALGGSSDQDAAIAEILGPSFEHDQVTQVIDKILRLFEQHRQSSETFLQTYRRIGLEPFKAAVYA
jgi:sulfite reductase (NADPH) hemoprotein beta-component